MPKLEKFDAKKTKVAHQWKHSAPLMRCRFAPDGQQVVASSEDRSIQRWSLDGKQRPPFLGHDSWIWDLAFAPDGRTLISGGGDDRLNWWDPDDDGDKPQPVRTVAAHRGWIRALAVSADGQFVASGGNDRVVKVWRLDDGSPVTQFEGHAREIYSLLFHPSGKQLLAGDLMGEVRQWSLESGKVERTFDAAALHTYNDGQQVDYGGVRSMAWSPDGKQLVCGGLHKASNPLGAVNDPIVLRFDWDSGKVVKTHVADGVKGAVWRNLFHGDGQLIAASGGSGGGFLLFWQPGEDKAGHKLKLPDTARDLDLHPDGNRLATAHHKGQICICELT